MYGIPATSVTGTLRFQHWRQQYSCQTLLSRAKRSGAPNKTAYYPAL